MKLVDLLHFCLTAQRTGKISLNEKEGPGVIFLKSGEITRIDFGSLHGEDAFFALIRDPDRTCHFEEVAVEEESRLPHSTRYLLMEAARRTDEDPSHPSSETPTEVLGRHHQIQYGLIFLTMDQTLFSLEGDTVVIGRDRDCHITVPDVSVSGRHCRIIWNGREHLLDDLGSFNGTYLNGAQLTRACALSPGDRFQVGLCHFEYTRLDESQKVTDPKAAVPFTFTSETQRIALPPRKTEFATLAKPGHRGSNPGQTPNAPKKRLWPFKR